jgi:hypothetical protein
MLSRLSLKEITPEEIFKYSKKNSVSDWNNDKNKDEGGSQLQRLIYYSQLESNYRSILNIRNPITNDLDKPETDFKDSFLMKHEYTFNEPLLIQKNSHLTKFDFSNYVFFVRMPFLYPLEDKETNKIMIKHINNEIIYKNGINLKSSSSPFKNFVEKYLKRAIEEGLYNARSISEFDPIPHKYFNVEINNWFSSNKKHMDYYDINMVHESVDFIHELFDNTEESREMSMNNMSRYRTYFSKTVKNDEDVYNMDKLVDHTKFLQYKKNEVEKVIKNQLKESVYCNGYIVFKNYEEKKHFLRSAAGIFGLHLQGRNVRFYDADFCNILESNYFYGERNIEDIRKLINSKLRLGNCHNLLVELPSYINESSNMTSNIIDKDKKIYIRFNNFLSAFKALEVFNNEPRLFNV